ncbi:MAG TPA: DUF2339 domain-containing protein [Terriglobales bacterium]|nr:DUF2339 domain-containing protein [Terriglobales bacterium]
MGSSQEEFLELQRQVAELTRRVYHLEQAAGIAPIAPVPSASLDKPPVPNAAPPPAPAGTALHVVPSDRNLENVIGSQWLNRIGIVALLTGAAYFLKLAIDNHWIGPGGQVAIGLLAGVALVFWSNFLHGRGYKYFSYSLTAVGVGVMYLSLWAAFQLYHLVPASVAFVAMIMVTASAAALAVRMEAQILAAVALAGGFATPMLLSTGQNRPVELFSYLLLLDIFAVILVTARPWRRLLLGAFVMTTVYYVGWHFRFYTNEQRVIAISFASMFFALFACLPLIRRIQLPIAEEAKALAHVRSRTLIAIALLNPILYFIQVYALYDEHPQSLAWLAVLLAAIYIGLSRRLQDDLEALPENQQFERWLHLAIGLGFLTTAIPLKLEAHWITIGWFVEAALLLAVGNRFDNAFLKNSSIAALALGIFRLLFIDNFHPTQLIFNARFATYLVAIAVFAGIAWQLRQEHGSKHKAFAIAILCLNLLALWGSNLEIADHFNRQYQAGFNHNAPYDYGAQDQSWRTTMRSRDFTYSALWMIYGALALVIGFWRKLAFLRWQALVLIAITIAKVFLYDLKNLSGALRVLSFIGLGALLMAISFLYQKGYLTAGAEE